MLSPSYITTHPYNPTTIQFDLLLAPHCRTRSCTVASFLPMMCCTQCTLELIRFFVRTEWNLARSVSPFSQNMLPKSLTLYAQTDRWKL